jgi:hypothetical protein
MLTPHMRRQLILPRKRSALITHTARAERRLAPEFRLERCVERVVVAPQLGLARESKANAVGVAACEFSIG